MVHSLYSRSTDNTVYIGTCTSESLILILFGFIFINQKLFRIRFNDPAIFHVYSSRHQTRSPNRAKTSRFNCTKGGTTVGIFEAPELKHTRSSFLVLWWNLYWKNIIVWARVTQGPTEWCRQIDYHSPVCQQLLRQTYGGIKKRGHTESIDNISSDKNLIQGEDLLDLVCIVSSVYSLRGESPYGVIQMWATVRYGHLNGMS